MDDHEMNEDEATLPCHGGSTSISTTTTIVSKNASLSQENKGNLLFVCLLASFEIDSSSAKYSMCSKSWLSSLLSSLLGLGLTL
jgi:hypothetical protein